MFISVDNKKSVTYPNYSYNTIWEVIAKKSERLLQNYSIYTVLLLLTWNTPAIYQKKIYNNTQILCLLEDSKLSYIIQITKNKKHLNRTMTQEQQKKNVKHLK